MKKVNTKALALTAILIAMEVVLSRFLSINMWNQKIGFSFIPVMLAAYLMGPIAGALVGGMGDLIGALLFPIGTYFPGFTATAALTGLVFGLLWHKKCNIQRILIAVFSTQIVCTLFINTLWISILYGSPYWPLFVTRIVQAVIGIVLEIAFAEICFERVKVLKKIKM